MEEISLQEALDIAVKKHKNGQLKEAEFIYKKVLEKNPKNSDALNLLGLIEYERKNYEKAIELIKRAITIKKEAEYYGNIATVYGDMGEDEKSAQFFEEALKINPKYEKAYVAHYNIGVFQSSRGKFQEALKHYNKSLELNPDFAEAHWNRSFILLRDGKFEEGWKEYSYRFKKKDSTDSRIFNKPKWNGEILAKKRILVICEQGFGDNIQFVRYIPLIKKEKGGYIILECRREIEGLFRNIEGVDEISIKNKENNLSNNFDCYVHLMELPGIFKTTLENMASKIPYIKANSEISEELREILKTNKLKVGIVWAGNPNQDNDKNRSAQFKDFELLEQIPGICLFSLQKGEAEKELKSNRVINLSNKIKNFSDTAVLIENLDLIISVDTSVAHLAGAMGKRVWTLLTYFPDWRWLNDRTDNPWYPNMRLFRQREAGNWTFVMTEVKKELENYVKNR